MCQSTLSGSISGYVRAPFLLMLLFILCSGLTFACGAPSAEECHPLCAQDRCGMDDGCGAVCSCPEPAPDDPADQPGPQGDYPQFQEEFFALSSPVALTDEPVQKDPEGQVSSMICIPWCEGKECGGDGCGGTCGACDDGVLCVDGGCQCVPTCDGASCGNDGCGGSCGECAPPDQCLEGQCHCLPDCEGKECGEDGCGGNCGACGQQDLCIDGTCICQPACGDKECGADGCGGGCGACGQQDLCIDGTCICQPACGGKECGADGCGGDCGSCAAPELCINDQCVCVPDCAGKQCGGDGCGGDCGSCAAPELCINDQCVCVPDCADKQCGEDGCGGDCGACGQQDLCIDGMCVCQPDCGFKNCADDGCGGSCGQCEDWEACQEGWCQVTGEDGDCKDILLCAVSCPIYQECIDDCYDQSSVQGQEAYDHMVNCSDTTCGEFPNQSADKQLCLVQWCPDSWSDCLDGWGSQDCMFILQCLPGCGGDPACQWGCIFAGSLIAQELFWQTQTCIDDHCDHCGMDQACLDECMPVHCLNEVWACQDCPPCPNCP